MNEDIFARLNRSAFRSRSEERRHPVFVAQHATGTCCRQCLQKWHRIAPGKELTAEQQRYVVDIILHWIENQLAR